MFETVVVIVNLSVLGLRGGNKILLLGNDGSICNTQHLTGQLMSRFYFDRPAPPANSFTTDISILTAMPSPALPSNPSARLSASIPDIQLVYESIAPTTRMLIAGQLFKKYATRTTTEATAGRPTSIN